MKNYMQVATGVPVFPLLFELHTQPELWNRNPCRLGSKGPHRETQDIFLRYKDERPNIETDDWSDFSDPHIPTWYSAIDVLPSARPIIRNLMTGVHGEMLGGVFIYKVKPGRRIYPHADPGWHPEYYDKFNVCLMSNPKARFEYPHDEEAMVQRPGDIHWFRNDTVHQVINEGDCDHIIMTVCIHLDDGERVPPSPAGWTMDASMARRHAKE